MPIYNYLCPRCQLKTGDHLFKSFEQAQSVCPDCENCGERTKVDVVFTFSGHSFKPFKTAAFNSQPGQAEMEITDASQLRRLLRTNKMADMGDTRNSYFGSNPKSVPTLEEISKFGRPHDEQAMAKRAKLVKVSSDPIGDKKKLDLAADQTNFGRRQSATRQEFVVGRP